MLKLGASVLIYVMSPASYNFCATLMVLFTLKLNLVLAACCNVEVIKGALGLTFTGFFDTSLIRRSSDLTISSIRLASSCFKSGSDFFLFKENLIL